MDCVACPSCQHISCHYIPRPYTAAQYILAFEYMHMVHDETVVGYPPCMSHRDCLVSQRCRSSQCRGAKPEGSPCTITEDCFQGSFCGRDSFCHRDESNYITSVLLFILCLILAACMTIFMVYQYRKRIKTKVSPSASDTPKGFPSPSRSQGAHHQSTMTIMVEKPNILVQPPFLLSVTSPLHDPASKSSETATG